MGYGQRDSFAENIGDFLELDGSANVGMASIRTSRSKRKSKKRRAMARPTHRRKKSHKRRKVRHHKSRKSHKKRKGMSKEFLRKLRQKHGLGEYKK